MSIKPIDITAQEFREAAHSRWTLDDQRQARLLLLAAAEQRERLDLALKHEALLCDERVSMDEQIVALTAERDEARDAALLGRR